MVERKIFIFLSPVKLTRWRGRKLLALAGALVLAGCQPVYERLVDKPGFEMRVIRGKSFLHRVIEKSATGDREGVLHVYLEGDGRPWRTRYQVAPDPTPRHLPMLELMAADPAAAVYIGRPCYLAVNDDQCQFLWWTHRRYAPEVVASLNAVLDRYAEKYRRIYLIGHSGGGTLAMLMAANRTDITGVITLAGNLDIDSWADFHHYSRLEGSLNPIDHPLPVRVIQRHYVGREDKMVPWRLVANAVKQSPNVALRVIDGVDHDCCWDEVWPGIFSELGPLEMPARD